MRNSIIVEEFGGPEQLKWIEEESLPLTEKSVRIAVKAVGVNRADVLQRTGAYHGMKPPVRPGLEGSGVVLESASERFPVGTNVVLFANRTGLYTTETVSDEKHLAVIPAGVTFEQAAAIPINWLTAWYCITKLIRLQAGETIFIPAAASGVGYAAVQIAKHCGAQVIAAASSAGKLAVATEYGADATFNYRERDTTEAIRDLTAGKGTDTFLDTVGGKTFAQGLKALAPFGRVAALANVTLEDSLINTRDFYPKNAAIYGFQYGNLLNSGRYHPAEDMETILKLVANGTFRVLVAKSFPLAEAPAAHRFLESRDVMGKLVLTP
ncbi:MAG: zinc-binding dehydrogenase [Blastocatellia bacterium]|nr:zinc-binding dehydrogenase [Blastocatellia bacterium]